MKQRSRRRITQWNLFFNYASIALAIVSGIVMVPLYLRFIPLDLYGAWLATGNILAWITVIDPGISTVLQQQVSTAYGKRDIGELNALLTGGVLISGGVSLLILLAGFVSSRFIVVWLNLNTPADMASVEQAFVIAVLGTALMIFSYGLTAFNQGLLSSIGIGIAFVITMVLSLVITAVLLYKGMGLLALPIGLVVRGLGLTVSSAGYLLWRYKVEELLCYRFSMRGITKLAKLTAYTFFSRTAGVIASNMDAFVISRFLGVEAAPVFVLTRKAPDICRAFLERPAIAFMPAISHMVGTGEKVRAKIILVRLLSMVLWLLGLVVSGFVLYNESFISLWVGPHLFAGNTVNLIITFSLIVMVLVNVLSSLCFSFGNIKGNSVADTIQGLLSIPLMVVGANYWGMVGVALAPLLAMLAVSVWYYPYKFSSLLRLESKDAKFLAKEILFVVIASFISMGGFYWLKMSFTLIALNQLLHDLAILLNLDHIDYIIDFSLFTHDGNETWFCFVLIVAVFSAVYTLLLSLLSHSFRIEIMTFLKRG